MNEQTLTANPYEPVKDAVVYLEHGLAVLDCYLDIMKNAVANGTSMDELIGTITKPLQNMPPNQMGKTGVTVSVLLKQIAKPEFRTYLVARLGMV